MERETMLKAAIAACFKAREPVTPTNVRAKLPADFWLDETGAELADEIVFAEIQSTYAHVAHAAAMVAETPDGRKLAPVEPFPNYLPPSEKAQGSVSTDTDLGSVSTDTDPAPVETAPAEQSAEGHAAIGPGQDPRTRLDAARSREADLIAARPQLANAAKLARADLADAVRNFQNADPNRTTPEIEAARFRETSQRERAARVARESGGGPDRIAYVDAERKYSQGGDANAMARRRNATGNRRGAFSRQSLGQVNRDPSRGPVPAPVAPPRPTIPALAGK